MSRSVLLITAMSCLGCGESEQTATAAQVKATQTTTKPSPSGTDSTTPAELQSARKQIFEQLPKAAGIPMSDYRKLVTSATAPRIRSLESQPFSLVLLTLTPIGIDANPESLNQEYRLLKSFQPRPREIDDAIRTSQVPEFATYLQPKVLSDLTCEIKGPIAKGAVLFHLKGLLAGKVQYVARKNKDQWQITEFHLPTWDAHTILKDGKWMASGAGVLPKSYFVKRPAANWSLPRFEGFRALVYLGYKRNSFGQREGVQYVFQNETVSLEQLETRLKDALESAKPLKTKPAAVVVHADAELPVTTILQVMRLAESVGYEEARIAVNHTGDIGTSAMFGHPSSWGELSIRQPSSKPKDQKDKIPMTIRVHLIANPTGSLANLMYLNTPLGLGEAAFQRLHQKTRDAVGFQKGRALNEDVVGEIVADPKLKWRYVINAFAACAGEMQKQAEGQFNPKRYLKEITLLGPNELNQEAKKIELVDGPGKKPAILKKLEKRSASMPAEKPVLPLPKHAITKGSFSLWTNPEKPKPGQQYVIMAQFKVPKNISRYPLRDLSGFLQGTDGYKDYFGGPTQKGDLPVHNQVVRMQILRVPGAAKLVKDIIKIESKILKDKQTIEINFK